ncbi:cell division protein FtsA [bacterium]|nr:cell division protein FtsA [bacterium]
MAQKSNIVVGLDIGTTKIAVVVAERTSSSKSESKLDIIGVGTHPSTGLRKGVVINIEATVNSIRRAVEEAQIMAGCQISSVYAGIAGSHIKSFNSHGIVAVKNKEVTPKDVERVIDAARAIPIPPDREVLHILPQEYIVDDQDGIRDPIGMAGVRLEAKVHIVTGSVSSAQNIVKCANRVGLNVLDIVLEPLASAEAVLSPEEKELGVAMIDIGGGTTDITIFHDGAVKHTAVLPIGGNHLTADIAAGLRTPTSSAEAIKKKYGCALASLVANGEMVDVPLTGGREPRSMTRQALAEIIQPRAEEIFTLTHRELLRSGLDELLSGGVVICGGSSLLEGTAELAEQILNIPVRKGSPTGVGGLIDVVNSPAYATGVGLVLYGAQEGEYEALKISHDQSLFTKVKARMIEWFADHF